MELIKMILEAIKSVPNVIWSAIIASLLTLIGVLLTNKGNNLRFTKQLEHEGSQRDKEREINLRREVYLSASEAIAEAQGSITKFPNSTIQELQDRFNNSTLSANLNKIHIVASERTVSAIGSFGERFSEAIASLMVKKIVLQTLEDEVKTINENINSMLATREQILEQIQEIPKTQENSAYIDTLFKQFNETDLPLNTLFEERDTKTPKLLEQNFAYQQECLDESFSVGQTLIEANLAIRQELKLPIDEGFYTNLMTEQYNSAKQSFEKYIEKIKLQLDANETE